MYRLLFTQIRSKRIVDMFGFTNRDDSLEHILTLDHKERERIILHKFTAGRCLSDLAIIFDYSFWHATTFGT